jgi:hypothetical protein
MVGASGTSIAQKPGIKPGFCIFSTGHPGAYRDLVGSLPDGVTIVDRMTAPLDMVHLFATQAAGLADALPSCRDAVAPAGMVWVSWPKKTSGVVSDLSDVVVRGIGLKLGLVDIKVCAVDAIWSGLKFVLPKKARTIRKK